LKSPPLPSTEDTEVQVHDTNTLTHLSEEGIDYSMTPKHDVSPEIKIEPQYKRVFEYLGNMFSRNTYEVSSLRQFDTSDFKLLYLCLLALRGTVVSKLATTTGGTTVEPEMINEHHCGNYKWTTHDHVMS
jgi:hypothetical protein